MILLLTVGAGPRSYQQPSFLHHQITVITMHYVLTILLTTLWSCATLPLQAQSKEDKRTAKAITKVGSWEAEKLFSDGKPVNLKAVVGEVYIDFESKKETTTQTITDKKGRDKKKKITEVVNVFRMEIGGNDRIFNYEVKNDSIQFVGLKGWNDYRIVRLEKEELVLEQVLDNSLMRWVLVPFYEEEEKKR